MTQKNEVILSGVRPTGRMHYGNYFGAIKQFLALQDQGQRCYYFVADYHALTTIKERVNYEQITYDMLRTYVACGLDPKKSVIYRQSDLPSTAELTLLLGMIANIGFLERGTTYKDTVAKLGIGSRGHPRAVSLSGKNSESQSYAGSGEGNPISYGLLGYPVLMAADILIVRADKVPVGDDQRQHVEMAIDLAQKFNSRFQCEALHIPQATSRNALRLPGLDGTAKMGKSENNDLGLLDDPATVLQKIKAVQTATDPGPIEGDSNEPDAIIPQLPPSLGTLYRLLSLIAPRDVYLDFVGKYRRKEKFYGTLKKSLAEYVNAFNAPIIARYNAPDNTEATVKAFLVENAKKVTPVALETVESCREAMGIGRSLYRA